MRAMREGVDPCWNGCCFIGNEGMSPKSCNTNKASFTNIGGNSSLLTSLCWFYFMSLKPPQALGSQLRCKGKINCRNSSKNQTQTCRNVEVLVIFDHFSKVFETNSNTCGLFLTAVPFWGLKFSPTKKQNPPKVTPVYPDSEPPWACRRTGQVTFLKCYGNQTWVAC